MVLSRLYSSAA